jgi:hypothetical protein
LIVPLFDEQSGNIHRVDPHDLGQAGVKAPPHAPAQIPEVGRRDLLEGLLFGGLQLLDDVAVVRRLGKVRPRLATPSLPSTTSAQARMIKLSRNLTPIVSKSPCEK